MARFEKYENSIRLSRKYLPLGDGVDDYEADAKRSRVGTWLLLEEHRARQITLQDINESDLIFVMDRNNLRNLEQMFGYETANQEKIQMLMEFCGYHREVADPWYTGDFEATYRDVVMGCEAI